MRKKLWRGNPVLWCIESLRFSAEYWNSTIKSPGGVLPYISHIGTCRPIGWGFSRRLGLKTSVQFENLVWNRVWFSMELQSVLTYLSFQFQISKKEREICEFETDLNNFFGLRSNLSNDNIISA